MKKYYVTKISKVIYSAIVEAESQEEAESIFCDVDIDSCFCEETCADISDCYEIQDIEEYDIPVIKK